MYSLVGQSMIIESLKTKLKHWKEFSRSKYKYGKLKHKNLDLLSMCHLTKERRNDKAN